MPFKSALLALVLLAQAPRVWAPPALQDEDVVYDEIFDSTGRVRPHYAEIYAIYKSLSKSELRQFLKLSRADFHGDNALHPLPRIMTESEIELLRSGVAQRGEAIRRFLVDHYSGSKNYLKAGIFPPGFIDRVTRTYGEHAFEGVINPETIAFTYGPDIVRAPDGSFMIIEDNCGNIGGLGDLIAARASIARIPEYRSVLNMGHDPAGFYRQLAKSFHEARSNHGPIVLFRDLRTVLTDQEDMRSSRIFADLGVEVVSPRSEKQLDVRSDGVYLVSTSNPQSPATKVGFIFMLGEMSEFGTDSGPYRDMHIIGIARSVLEDYALVRQPPSVLTPEQKKTREFLLRHPASDRRLWQNKITEALVPDQVTGNIDVGKLETLLSELPHITVDTNEFARRFPKGLVDALARGVVAGSYSPGVDFTNDKEFYIYVEKLIEFYMKAPPILHNIPTRSVAADHGIIERFASRPADYVVKGTTGRGGDQVHIGKKMSAKAVRELREEMLRSPTGFIVQDKIALSVFDNLIVDTRMLAWISKLEPVVGHIPWGRGQSVDADGKVNLGGSGREVAIIPVRDPNFPSCKRLRRASEI